MVITASEGADGFTSNDPSLNLIFTASEDTTDFVVADISFSNGAISDFNTSSNTVYTATFIPTA